MVASISVVIPTIPGRSAFLRAAIRSVMRQTSPATEVVIVMNGSSHVELIHVESTLPIRVFNVVAEAGPAQARNFGVSVSNSRYVGFLDDDDVWDKEYLSSVRREIFANPSAKLIVGTLWEVKEGVPRVLKSFNDVATLPTRKLVAICLLRNPGATGSVLTVDRSSFIALGGFDTAVVPSEDKALLILFLLAGEPVSSAPGAKAYMDNTARSDRAAQRREILRGNWRLLRRYRNELSLTEFLVRLARLLLIAVFGGTWRTPSPRPPDR